jgi:hypothetical protein
MSPRLSKLMLTTHISFSVGWFGAVAAFLALSIAGLTGHGSELVRSAYLAMELIARFVIVPFCIAAFVSGVIQSLGTSWGLFKYYWIVVKLLLTIAATVVLLVHMQPIDYMAGIASEQFLSANDFRGLRIQLIADAGAALLVLLTTTTISVYKPWGRTPFAQDKRKTDQRVRRKPWLVYILFGLIVLVLLMFVVLHLTGAMGGH